MAFQFTARRLASSVVQALLFTLWFCGTDSMAEGAQTGVPIPRVRSSDETIRNLIDGAATLSTKFRRLIETIDLTNGIVYVEPGRCGHGVRACLVLSVTVAGPNRLLRIVVDTRKADCTLMASIGHELRHAIEVLEDPSVTSDIALYHFYTREGRHTTPDPLGAWETEAAVQAGIDVLAELRKEIKQRGRSCATP